ncbi:hypothetical protein C8R44DRAFT_846926, partial [Mycena epipterygia]
VGCRWRRTAQVLLEGCFVSRVIGLGYVVPTNAQYIELVCLLSDSSSHAVQLGAKPSPTALRIRDTWSRGG